VTTRIEFEDMPPALLTGVQTTEKYLSSIDIDLQLLELVRYYISQKNGCAYCLDMHFKEGLASGLTDQKLHSVALWCEAPFYSEKEKAVLRWVECAMAPNPPEGEAQKAFSSMEALFTKGNIANITLAIAQMNVWNIIAKSFGFVAGSYQVGMYSS